LTFNAETAATAETAGGKPKKSPRSETVLTTLVAAAAAIGLGLGALPGCAARRPGRSDYGIPHCAADDAKGLLAAGALQCWFDAAHGRWRTLSHESHYDVLVVHVQALDLRDAGEIARRFVAGENGTFSEILVYAEPEPPTGSARNRRVRWTRDTGFELLDFTAR
jgi:hypothetical protein